MLVATLFHLRLSLLLEYCFGFHYKTEDELGGCISVAAVAWDRNCKWLIVVIAAVGPIYIEPVWLGHDDPHQLLQWPLGLQVLDDGQVGKAP